jgi:hypothetical protein
MNMVEGKCAVAVTRGGGLRRYLSSAAVGTALLVASAQPVLASSQIGAVTQVGFAGGRFLFWMSGARTGAPTGCSIPTGAPNNTNYELRWEMTVADANSQARMSVVLTAYSQGKSVTVFGTGSCVLPWKDTEGVEIILTN